MPDNVKSQQLFDRYWEEGYRLVWKKTGSQDEAKDLYLIQQDYTVTVGKLADKEIDFVAEKNGAKLYVQVCPTLFNEQTTSREFGNLGQIADNYPKFVVTFNDPMIGENQKGILQKNLLDFLNLDLRIFS